MIKTLKFYKEYVIGNSSIVKFNVDVHVSKETLDYIHIDLWGPKQTAYLRELSISFLSLIIKVNLDVCLEKQTISV